MFLDTTVFRLVKHGKCCYSPPCHSYGFYNQTVLSKTYQGVWFLVILAPWLACNLNRLGAWCKMYKTEFSEFIRADVGWTTTSHWFILIHYCTGVFPYWKTPVIHFFVFLDRNIGPESSVFRVQSPGPGSSDSRMPFQRPLVQGWELASRSQL